MPSLLLIDVEFEVSLVDGSTARGIRGNGALLDKPVPVIEAEPEIVLPKTSLRVGR